MNHILVFDADFIATNKVELHDQRFKHCQQQLKLKLGDTVKIGHYRHHRGIGTVVALSSQSIQLSLKLFDAPPPPLPVTLLLAMPRPKVLRRVLRSAIELGVKDIYLINTWKVEKSYWQTPWLSDHSLAGINHQALSMAKDTIPAVITQHRRFKPFVEDELEQISQGQQKIIAHPSEESLEKSADNLTKTCLAIGPEGGFTDYEIEKLEAVGFEAKHLGPRILRVETAVSAALAKFL